MSDTPRTYVNTFHTEGVDQALVTAEFAAELERENAELVGTLIAARDEIQWWVNEHGCCAGKEYEVMARIDAAIAKSKERT